MTDAEKLRMDEDDVEVMLRTHEVAQWQDGGLVLRRVVCLDCGALVQEGTHLHEAMTEVRGGRVYAMGSRPFIEGLRYE